jgi:predicted amidohydrolase YtcJ
MTGGSVLRGARVVPMDGSAAPAPVDVRVQDGRIAAIGPSLAPAPDDTVVDLEGRFLVPGLWDGHTHMTQWALSRRRLDVSRAGSAAAAAHLVAGRVTGGEGGAVPAGALLVGFGFRDGLWPDEPAVELLDAACGDVPTVLVSGDLHCAWLSTAAAAVLGGAPSGGMLRESEWFAVLDRLGEEPEEVTDAWVLDACRAAAARGVVGIVDFEMVSATGAWTRRVAAGARVVRVVCSVWPTELDEALERGLATGSALPGSGGWLTVGPLKVITDGSLNTRTAYCHDPYPGLAGMGSRGRLEVAPAALVPLMARAVAGGLQCAIHAIGDLANELVLDAFAATGARGTVEHAQLISVPDAARMAALGVAASIQPEHAMDDRDVADRYWAGRTSGAFAFGTLARAGVRLVLGSDAPVAPLDPWVAMDAAVLRSRDGREPWHPEQRLSVGEALAASVRSSVAVGEVADLAVLDADPNSSPLRGMPVAATMCAGSWTFAGALAVG